MHMYTCVGYNCTNLVNPAQTVDLVVSVQYEKSLKGRQLPRITGWVFACISNVRVHSSSALSLTFSPSLVHSLSNFSFEKATRVRKFATGPTVCVPASHHLASHISKRHVRPVHNGVLARAARMWFELSCLWSTHTDSYICPVQPSESYCVIV